MVVCKMIYVVSLEGIESLSVIKINRQEVRTINWK